VGEKKLLKCISSISNERESIKNNAIEQCSFKKLKKKLFSSNKYNEAKWSKEREQQIEEINLKSNG